MQILILRKLKYYPKWQNPFIILLLKSCTEIQWASLVVIVSLNTTSSGLMCGKHVKDLTPIQ